MAVPSSVSECLRRGSTRGMSAGHFANDEKEAEVIAPAHLCKGLTRSHLSSITVDGCARQAYPRAGWAGCACVGRGLYRPACSE